MQSNSQKKQKLKKTSKEIRLNDETIGVFEPYIDDYQRNQNAEYTTIGSGKVETKDGSVAYVHYFELDISYAVFEPEGDILFKDH